MFLIPFSLLCLRVLHRLRNETKGSSYFIFPNLFWQGPFEDVEMLQDSPNNPLSIFGLT